MKIIKLSQTSSTNLVSQKLLMNNEIKENTVVYARSQTSGRGMGTNTWHSESDKNLLFSLVFFADIKAEKHFFISMIVSLAICDYLVLKGIEANIKWPNDIVYENKKMAGILIENSILGNTIKTCVVGVGLNLNQIDFPSELPNPVSVKNITGENYNIDEEINAISHIISDKLVLLKQKSLVKIRELYYEKLYKFNEISNFKVNGETFAAKIINVEKDGRLIIKDLHDNVTEYYFKEIELMNR